MDPKTFVYMGCTFEATASQPPELDTSDLEVTATDEAGEQLLADDEHHTAIYNMARELLWRPVGE